jgi:hypothetical protein
MLKIRLVPDHYLPVRILEKKLETAQLHQQQYLGTNPILLRLHKINVQWRQQNLNDRLSGKVGPIRRSRNVNRKNY